MYNNNNNNYNNNGMMIVLLVPKILAFYFNIYPRPVYGTTCFFTLYKHAQTLSKPTIRGQCKQELMLSLFAFYTNILR